MKELRAIQRANGYIPATALRELSERTGTPLYQLQGSSASSRTFAYAAATRRGAGLRRPLVPPARRRRAAGRDAGARGRSRARRAPSSAPSSCLGRCDRAPACAVNDVIVTRVTRDSLMDAVAAAAAGTPLPGDAVVRDPRTLDVDPYGPASGYGAARKLAASGDTDGVIASLKASDCAGWAAPAFRPA